MLEVLVITGLGVLIFCAGVAFDDFRKWLRRR
jgi:hypothetical protein